MIYKQRFARTIHRLGLRSLEIDRHKLIISLSALVTMWCVNGLGADSARLPVILVTASADDGNVAANSLDNNLATRWSAQGDGQWIFFDLGTRFTVASAR